MTSPVPHVFVYGTLRPAATSELGRDQRARLAAQSHVEGDATLAGRLYDLGRYPGLVLDREPLIAVHGTVLNLVDADATFEWLDRYEGISTPASATDEYIRIIRDVRLASGVPLGCWVYAYAWDVGSAPLVATGRWG